MNMQIAKEIGIPKIIRDSVTLSISEGFFKEVEDKYEHRNGFSYSGRSIIIFGKDVKVLLIAIPFELMQKEFVYIFDVKNVDILSYAMQEKGEKLSKEEREKYLEDVIKTIDSIIDPMFAKAHYEVAIKTNEVN